MADGYEALYRRILGGDETAPVGGSRVVEMAARRAGTASATGVEAAP